MERAIRATSGRSLPSALAWYDREASSWKTYQGLLMEPTHTSLLSLETWPESGTTRDGALYPLPPLAPRTSVGAGGVLPTPQTTDAEPGGGPPNKRANTKRWGGVNSLGQMAKQDLWPTPDASVANDGEHLDTWLARRERVKKTARNGNGMGIPLTIAVQLNEQLMWRTPYMGSNRRGTVAKAAIVNALQQGERPYGTVFLSDQVGGKLNPRWTEWLMGLPIGWTSLEQLGTASYQRWWRSF